MKFIQKLNASLDKKSTNLCVGLDSRYDRIPPELFSKEGTMCQTIVAFNRSIIKATKDDACAYKMNVAFYAGFGNDGLQALKKTNEYIHVQYPDIPVIADCKRSEMGESVPMVEKEIFEWLDFDSVMVTPWFGFDTVSDYLSDPTHGVCVYVHDSNPSAGEFQDLELRDGRRVYEAVARAVASKWNTNGNVWVEAGATYPKQLKRIRTIIGPDMPLLVAGIGPQGGTVESLRGLFGTHGNRLLVNSSRGIIFAGVGKKDYFQAVHDAAKKFVSGLKEVKDRVASDSGKPDSDGGTPSDVEAI